MAIVKTQAIALRKTDFSDTSQVLQFLAEGHGVISGLARGSKRAKSAFQGAIDVLTLNEIVYYEKRSGLHTLTEVDLVTNFPGIRAQIGRMYCACYAAELVQHLARDSQHPKELFDLLREALYTIEGSESLVRTLFSFEIAALKVAGYLPLLDCCVSCGGAFQANGARVAFSPLLGGLLCTRCESKATNTVRVAAGAVSIARALGGAMARPERLRITKAQGADLRVLLDRFMETVLDVRLKSRRFLRRI